MKITLDWLKKENACPEGVEYYRTLDETDALKIMERLLTDGKLDFANWTICHLLDRKENRIKYAIFAALQVFPLWAKKYPKESAIWKKWADNPTAASAASISGAADISAALAFSSYLLSIPGVCSAFLVFISFILAFWFRLF